MSSSCEYPLPVTTLKYRDHTALADGLPLQDELDTADARKEVQLTKSEFAEHIAREQASAISQVEQRLREEYENKLLAARAPIAAAIRAFEQERGNYFAKVEAEIVQLSLAIAAKILHREAQVDPMLLAALVRIAIDNMREESSVTIRVSLGKGEIWREYFSAANNVSRIDVVEDPRLTNGECLLETELGSANFSIEKQLKEVEQGFFDLLALRPSVP